jgi:hypothetical protein
VLHSAVVLTAFAEQLICECGLNTSTDALFYRVNGPGWGTGSSPVLDGDRLFVQCDNDEKSFLVALDKKTGDELWRVWRDETTNYSTPLLWRNKQRTELVLGGKTVRSYDPATGEVFWELAVGGYCWCVSPVADEEHVYVGPPGRLGLFAVKAGASGELDPKPGTTSNAGIAWSQPRGTMGDRASPLVYQGYLYTLSQSGQLSCFDTNTGKVAYKGERLPGARNCFASLWGYNNKVFCLSGDDGQTFVLQAGPEFKVLAKNALHEMMWSRRPFPAERFSCAASIICTASSGEPRQAGASFGTRLGRRRREYSPGRAAGAQCSATPTGQSSKESCRNLQETSWNSWVPGAPLHKTWEV